MYNTKSQAVAAAHTKANKTGETAWVFYNEDYEAYDVVDNYDAAGLYGDYDAEAIAEPDDDMTY